MDYSPFANSRDKSVSDFCKKYNIKLYCYEDILLHPILNNYILNNENKPYKVFTPFKNNLLKYKVDKPNKFNKFVFKKFNKLNTTKYYFNEYNKLYHKNNNTIVHGGKSNCLKLLKQLDKQHDYNNDRNHLIYQTTLLSAFINFNIISIRQLYWLIIKKLGKQHGLIIQLLWREFYYNILYYFPHVVGHNFNVKYDKINWNKSSSKFKLWCNGKTGFPIIDACMKQLNTTGYMHNRGRMIVASFLTKNLWTDWRYGEKYFANKLIDYNISANNGSWQWASSSGVDAQPYFRIFNPWIQSKKYDKDCTFIKYWIPELQTIPNNDIHNWFSSYKKYSINYHKPIVDINETKQYALKQFKKYL